MRRRLGAGKIAKKPTDRIKQELKKLRHAPATRRPTLRAIVAEMFDEIQASLAEHTYNTVAEAITEAGHKISANTLRQYYLAELRNRIALAPDQPAKKQLPRASPSAPALPPARRASRGDEPAQVRPTFRPHRPDPD